MTQLYQNIKKRRQELGLTQTELATRMGYADKSMISKIESGKVNLTQTRIFQFAEALHTTASELAGWDVEQEAASLFAALDDMDKGAVIERMRILLEADKYKEKESPSATA